MQTGEQQDVSPGSEGCLAVEGSSPQFITGMHKRKIIIDI